MPTGPPLHGSDRTNRDGGRRSSRGRAQRATHENFRPWRTFELGPTTPNSACGFRRGPPLPVEPASVPPCRLKDVFSNPASLRPNPPSRKNPDCREKPGEPRRAKNPPQIGGKPARTGSVKGQHASPLRCAAFLVPASPQSSFPSTGRARYRKTLPRPKPPLPALDNYSATLPAGATS